MEELLQLHIVLRDELPDDIIDEWTDNLHDLLWTEGFVVVNNEAPSFDDLGYSVSTNLFERRADNMTQIEQFYAEIDSWDPSSTVFRHDYEQTFGEFRSPADPDTHIVLLATNWNVTQPSVRWKQHLDTLEAPPLIRNDRVYQADSSSMYALDADTGTELWASSASTVQVPVGNDDLVFGCDGPSVVAVDAATGDTEWRTEFDDFGQHMIDSRIAIGTDEVYVGLRNGDVRSISQANGVSDEFHSFTETPLQLAVVENGLLASTSDSEIHLINWNGDIEWTETFTPSLSIGDTHNGVLYGRSTNGVTAIPTAAGTTEWTTELPNVRDVTVSQETLLVTTKTSLHGLDPATGSQTWTYTPPEIEPITHMVHLGDAIACTGTRSVSLEEQVRPYSESLLHVFDPATEEPIVTYDLGIAECHGITAYDETLVCAMDDTLLCLEDFPQIAN